MAELAHRLQYYKELSVKDCDIRLNLYHKTELYLRAMPIGDVLTALNLNIDGQTEDIDAPIVKTSLTIGLVDAPERNTANVRCGDWEGFYTNDATGWKVELLGKYKDEKEYKVIWSGYVTPDSFTETLQYHGIVTITARDNIGHLQDFDFDAEGNGDGMITPYELITQAWAKIESPMVLDWRGTADSNEWPQAEEVNAIDMYMSVAAFKGKTWYDAVSETLYSLGLVMRYVGNNVVSICPLRRLPEQSTELAADLPHITPTFEAYATRELVPAVNDIEEVVQYDLQNGEDQPNVKEDDFDGTTVSCIVNAKDLFGEAVQKTITVCPITNESETGWGNIKSNTLFFDPSRYTVTTKVEPSKGQMFLAVNTEPRMVWYGRNIDCQNLVLKVEPGMMVERFAEQVLWVPSRAYELKSIVGALKLTLDGVEYYYNGETWATSYSELTLPFADGAVVQDIQFGRLQGKGLLQLFIFSIDVDWPLGYDFDKGAFLGIKALNISLPEGRSLMEKNTVKTVYNEVNNVRLKRTPSLGPAYDDVALPGLIANGIFRKYESGYYPVPEWKWPGDNEVLQLAAIVHKQLLCYHSKPNNLLSGTIVNADLLQPRAIWTWKGKNHLLLSGTYDFTTGYIEGVTLREYSRYDRMWLTWVDDESLVVDYGATLVSVEVHARKTLTMANVVGLPSWATASLEDIGDGVYKVVFSIGANSSSERSAMIKIDTARLRITQRTAGDYGLDYGEDYS